MVESCKYDQPDSKETISVKIQKSGNLLFLYNVKASMNGKQLYIQHTKIMKFTIFVKCENTITGKFQSVSKYKNHKIHYFCIS